MNNLLSGPFEGSSLPVSTNSECESVVSLPFNTQIGTGQAAAGDKEPEVQRQISIDEVSQKSVVTIGKRLHETTFFSQTNNPFRGSKRVHRKFARIPKEQQQFFNEQPALWYNPKLKDQAATLPESIRQGLADFIARKSERGDSKIEHSSDDDENEATESSDEEEDRKRDDIFEAELLDTVNVSSSPGRPITSPIRPTLSPGRPTPSSIRHTPSPIRPTPSSSRPTLSPGELTPSPRYVSDQISNGRDGVNLPRNLELAVPDAMGDSLEDEDEDEDENSEDLVSVLPSTATNKYPLIQVERTPATAKEHAKSCDVSSSEPIVIPPTYFDVSSHPMQSSIGTGHHLQAQLSVRLTPKITRSVALSPMQPPPMSLEQVRTRHAKVPKGVKSRKLAKRQQREDEYFAKLILSYRDPKEMVRESKDKFLATCKPPSATLTAEPARVASLDEFKSVATPIEQSFLDRNESRSEHLSVATPTEHSFPDRNSSGSGSMSLGDYDFHPESTDANFRRLSLSPVDSKDLISSIEDVQMDAFQDDDFKPVTPQEETDSDEKYLAASNEGDSHQQDLGSSSPRNEDQLQDLSIHDLDQELSLNFFDRYCSVYSEYTGNRQEFTLALVYLEWLHLNGHLLPTTHYDDFIRFYPEEYLALRGDKMGRFGYELFNDKVRKLVFRKMVIMPSNLAEALLSLNAKEVQRERSRFKSPRTSLFSRSTSGFSNISASAPPVVSRPESLAPVELEVSRVQTLIIAEEETSRIQIQNEESASEAQPSTRAAAEAPISPTPVLGESLHLQSPGLAEGISNGQRQDMTASKPAIPKQKSLERQPFFQTASQVLKRKETPTDPDSLPLSAKRTRTLPWAKIRTPREPSPVLGDESFQPRSLRSFNRHADRLKSISPPPLRDANRRKTLTTATVVEGKPKRQPRRSDISALTSSNSINVGPKNTNLFLAHVKSMARNGSRSPSATRSVGSNFNSRAASRLGREGEE